MLLKTKSGRSITCDMPHSIDMWAVKEIPEELYDKIADYISERVLKEFGLKE